MYFPVSYYDKCVFNGFPLNVAQEGLVVCEDDCSNNNKKYCKNLCILLRWSSSYPYYSKQTSHSPSVCLTREKVGTSHEGLPVDQAQGVHIHLLQRRLTVPQVYRPLQHLWGHVADRPHLVDGIKRGVGDEKRCEVRNDVKLDIHRKLHFPTLSFCSL